MSVVFETEGHKYTSVDLFDDTRWVSASKLPTFFKKEFDATTMALKCSTNKKSKWYGISPNNILGHWKAKNLRSKTLGTWYHEQEESKLNALTSLEYKGENLSLIKSVWEGSKKLAPDQKLKDGIYTELFLYLKSAGVCGQFDRVNICKGIVDIEDHKTNEDLKKPTFVNWEGITEKMQPPLLHLEANKVNEYALQLSIGMYIILRHNPLFKAGEMFLNHVTFEIEGEDKFGDPIVKLNANNEPILKGVEKVPVPYMKREVELMFEWLKYTRQNGNKIT